MPSTNERIQNETWSDIKQSVNCYNILINTEQYYQEKHGNSEVYLLEDNNGLKKNI